VRHSSHVSLMEHLNEDPHGTLTEHGIVTEYVTQDVTQDVTKDLKVENPFKLEEDLYTLDVPVMGTIGTGDHR
jgi:hypothetical protein